MLACQMNPDGILAVRLSGAWLCASGAPSAEPVRQALARRAGRGGGFGWRGDCPWDSVLLVAIRAVMASAGWPEYRWTGEFGRGRGPRLAEVAPGARCRRAGSAVRPGWRAWAALARPAGGRAARRPWDSWASRCWHSGAWRAGASGDAAAISGHRAQLRAGGAAADHHRHQPAGGDDPGIHGGDAAQAVRLKYTLPTWWASAWRGNGVVDDRHHHGRRTGASFAAHLGTMQVNEEIDALRTMGFDPMEFLVLPRQLALILMMLLLATYANFLACFGGSLWRACCY